jgi:hypothetical protein
MSILDLYAANADLLPLQPVELPASCSDVAAAFDALRSGQKRRRGDSGFKRRSAALLAHARRAINSEVSPELQDLRALRCRFNNRQLRYGDRCREDYGRAGKQCEGEPSTKRHKMHVNQWVASGSQLAAYAGVGRRAAAVKAHGNQLGRTRRSCDLACASARAHQRAMVSGVEAKILSPCLAGVVESLTVQRAYDAISIIVNFGRLKSRVSAHARYFILGEDNKWKAVRLSEWRVLRKQDSPARGSLELLAQQIHVGVAFSNDTVLEESVLVAPRFLEAGKSSVIFAATEKAVNGLSTRELNALATGGHVPYLFISEIPDACRANKRKRAEVITILMDTKNAFITPVDGCCVHALLGIVSSSDARDICGDIHAQAMVHSVVANHNKVVREFEAEVIDKFKWITDEEPDPSWSQHLQDILRETVGEDIRGSVDFNGASLNPQTSEERFKEACQKSRFINSDVRIPGNYCHYEKACGECKTKEEARDKFLAACSAVDVIVGQGGTRPAKNRWGTVHDAEGEQATGIMVYQAWPRSLCSAFRSYTTGDPGADEGDNFRRIMRGKCFRSRKQMGSRAVQVEQLTHFFCEKTITHLWKRIEYLDAKGGLLLDMCRTSTNPIKSAIEQLTEILSLPPDQTSLNVLLHNLALEDESLQQSKDYAFHKTTSMISLLKWKFRCFDDWPFRLIPGLHMDRPGRLELCQQLFHLVRNRNCCLEPLMAGKVAVVHDSPEALVADDIFWKGLRLWAHGVRVCNMHIERLLALIKQSMPSDKTPFLERLCANGFLSEWLAEHCKAGGEDPRHETAGQLISSGVALQRSVAKASVATSKRGGLRPAMQFANDRVREFRAEAGGAVSQDTLNEQRRAAHAQFRFLPQDVQDRVRRKVLEQKSVKQQQSKNETSHGQVPKFNTDSLFGLSSPELPLRREKFIESIGGDASCSFGSWGPQARNEFEEYAFVQDANDVPADKRFKFKLSCDQKHPGICSTIDCDGVDFFLRAGGCTGDRGDDRISVA